MEYVVINSGSWIRDGVSVSMGVTVLVSIPVQVIVVGYFCR